VTNSSFSDSNKRVLSHDTANVLLMSSFALSFTSTLLNGSPLLLLLLT
jgi:hypothetical protein